MESITQNIGFMNGSLELTEIQNRVAIVFHFEGLLTQQKAQEYVKQWHKIFLSHNKEKIIIVFNASQMSDYQPMARVVFQTAIKELKTQIDSIWVISNSKVIKAGAALMSIFSSFQIATVGSLDDIKMK
ncbi:hypothetical protein QWY31_08570 [Cytophagales bacterium LB-30]|uniref:STAS/SEC14 domain-containing protein n=1 Tax=Shiella aurantiaca TaxID=3058365 RepID=A0ABT8F505_9BACT|nr:hypothetical protein [Shiella aurantiaca]MDN4165552.1 hypothetical protein [Shiella aurantiaca]